MEALQNELQSEQSKWLVNTWSNWVLMGAVVHTLPRPLCSCRIGLSFTDLITGTCFEKLCKKWETHGSEHKPGERRVEKIFL